MGSDTLVNKKFLCSNFWHFIALGFGSGLSKIAPGSFGTLMTFVYFFMIHKLDFQLQCLIYILLFWLSFVSTQKTLLNLNVKDPSCIVIDEIIAFLFVLIWLPFNPYLFFIAFILFRLFDIIKPWPISLLEKLPGACGVIADDMGAALATLILTLLINIYVFA